MAVFYLDASAIVKLVISEEESLALKGVISSKANLVSSKLAITEVLRAAQKIAAAQDSNASKNQLFEKAKEVLGSLTLIDISDEILASAGGIKSPTLRSLDAIHLATALTIIDVLSAFISYDHRQLEVAQMAGLSTLSPVS